MMWRKFLKKKYVICFAVFQCTGIFHIKTLYDTLAVRLFSSYIYFSSTTWRNNKILVFPISASLSLSPPFVHHFHLYFLLFFVLLVLQVVSIFSFSRNEYKSFENFGWFLKVYCFTSKMTYYSNLILEWISIASQNSKFQSSHRKFAHFFRKFEQNLNTFRETISWKKIARIFVHFFLLIFRILRISTGKTTNNENCSQSKFSVYRPNLKIQLNYGMVFWCLAIL